MWYWFSKRGDIQEIPGPGESMISCSDVVELASSLEWDDWATFLTMSRNHKIDDMSKETVETLLNSYKANNVTASVEMCTPRQLSEFIYLLTPERWETFKRFTSSADINTLSFADLLIKFHTFEYEQIRTM